MKSLAILAAALVGFTFSIGDAEAAKRLGAGKSFGMQRSAPPPTKPAATASPTTPAAAAPGAGAPAAATAGRSWMGPVAGLAAGLGLAALASHLGFGEELATFLMMGLIALAVLALVGVVLRKRTASAQPAFATGGAGPSPAGFQRSTWSDAPGSSGSAMKSAPPQVAEHSPSGNGPVTAIPADFDSEGFLRNAKVQFIRLQAANDAGNLDDLRNFTTPEVFAELRLAISERDRTAQATDVVELDAQLLEVAEEDTRYVASVRFSGRIREDQGPVEAIDEIWHLTKPRSGGGWLLAGLQQTA